LDAGSRVQNGHEKAAVRRAYSTDRTTDRYRRTIPDAEQRQLCFRLTRRRCSFSIITRTGTGDAHGGHRRPRYLTARTIAADDTYHEHRLGRTARACGRCEHHRAARDDAELEPSKHAKTDVTQSQSTARLRRSACRPRKLATCRCASEKLNRRTTSILQCPSMKNGGRRRSMPMLRRSRQGREVSPERDRTDTNSEPRQSRDKSEQDSSPGRLTLVEQVARRDDRRAARRATTARTRGR